MGEEGQPSTHTRMHLDLEDVKYRAPIYKHVLQGNVEEVLTWLGPFRCAFCESLSNPNSWENERRPSSLLPRVSWRRHGIPPRESGRGGNVRRCGCCDTPGIHLRARSTLGFYHGRAE